jgi:hypothetical protein
LAIGPDERPAGAALRLPGYVRQGSVSGQAEGGRTGEFRGDVFRHRNWAAAQFASTQIERDRAQRAGHGIHQVSRLGIVRARAARNQNLLLPRLQIEDGDLGVFRASRRSENRKEHRPAVWKISGYTWSNSPFARRPS